MMSRMPEINGTALHRKLIDIVLVPLIVASLLWIGRTVMGNQTKLVEIEQRLHTIETKTTLMPPADYRAYMEAKFAETNRRIEDLTEALREHATRSEP